MVARAPELHEVLQCWNYVVGVSSHLGTEVHTSPRLDVNQDEAVIQYTSSSGLVILHWVLHGGLCDQLFKHTNPMELLSSCRRLLLEFNALNILYLHAIEVSVPCKQNSTRTVTLGRGQGRSAVRQKGQGKEPAKKLHKGTKLDGCMHGRGFPFVVCVRECSFCRSKWVDRLGSEHTSMIVVLVNNTTLTSPKIWITSEKP